MLNVHFVWFLLFFQRNDFPLHELDNDTDKVLLATSAILHALLNVVIVDFDTALECVFSKENIVGSF